MIGSQNTPHAFEGAQDTLGMFALAIPTAIIFNNLDTLIYCWCTVQMCTSIFLLELYSSVICSCGWYRDFLQFGPRKGGYTTVSI